MLKEGGNESECSGVGKSERTWNIFRFANLPLSLPVFPLLPPHKQVALLENPPIGRVQSLATPSLAGNSRQAKVLPHCIIKRSP